MIMREQCGGSGLRSQHVCNVCGGSGQVLVGHVSSEDSLRRHGRPALRMRAAWSRHGRRCGGRSFRVRLAKHRDFKVEEAMFRGSVAPWEAVLGAQVRVPTALEEAVNIKILRGHKTPRAARAAAGCRNGGTRGDLCARRIGSDHYGA
jgi:DnaJ-class molecular chaperone